MGKNGEKYRVEINCEGDSHTGKEKDQREHTR